MMPPMVEMVEAAMVLCTDCDEPQTDLTDMLTNLMHYAAYHGCNFDDALRMASVHFQSEKGVI